MPITAIPANHGIGDFGPEVKKFINIIKMAHFSRWQILPLNPIGYANSPYQAFSSKAIDPIYISLDYLFEDGLLHENPGIFNNGTTKIDYQKVRDFKYKLLLEAFNNFVENEDYYDFLSNNIWVKNYAIFACLKEKNDNKSWINWEKSDKDWIKSKNKPSISDEDYRFQIFLQYILFKQWMEIKSYANDLGVLIIGDIPMYVGTDSIDVYENQHLFEIDDDGNPVYVAGVPADDFHEEGQLWGNPVYKWDELEKENFNYWIDKIEYNLQLFDYVRLDHFRAFDTFWRVDAENDTAINGEWIVAKGQRMFEILSTKIDCSKLIAEDLGKHIRHEMYDLKYKYNLIGMHIFQSLGGNVVPYQTSENSICYTGTHDNPTLKEWIDDLDTEKFNRLDKSFKVNSYDDDIQMNCINAVLKSNSKIAIIPITDLLSLGKKGRFNTPGTMNDDNWTFKLNGFNEFSKLIHQFKLMNIKAHRVNNNLSNINVYYDQEYELTIYGENLPDYQFIYIENDEKYNLNLSRILDDNNKRVYTFSCLIDFEKQYYIEDQYSNQYPIINRFITKTPQFNDEFYYDGDDLGANYTTDKTIFKVWAPTATRLELLIDHVRYPMKKNKGIFEVKVDGDLDGKLYNYIVTVNNHTSICTDPYGISSNTNGVKSAVIDKSQIKCKVHKGFDKSYVDSIIYELSLRDYLFQFKDNFESMFIANSITGLKHDGYSVGLDHIKELGITHVQLMPVFDFATVDEFKAYHTYNWGYDPQQYLSLDGSYSSNAENPYSRIYEFKNLVETYHENNLYVNLDVVFNHVYLTELFANEVLVPYYFIRYDRDRMSDGSFCGNDLESNSSMMRKYLIDICKKYIEFYDIDGLRFDLMGIIDYQTINEITSACQSIKPGFMIYGEGWNMPTAISDDLKGSDFNSYKMENVAFFNDTFRNAIKFLFIDNINTNLLTSCFEGKKFNICQQSINYIECHDNHTIFDFLEFKNQDNIIKKIKIMNTIVLLSSGIPFIHAGQEFGRSKKGYENSYNALDEINQVDWNLKKKNKDLFEFTKKAIQLRKSDPAFNTCVYNKNVYKLMYFNDMLYYQMADYLIVINLKNDSKDFEPNNSKLLLSSGNDNPNVIEGLTVKVYFNQLS